MAIGKGKHLSGYQTLDYDSSIVTEQPDLRGTDLQPPEPQGPDPQCAGGTAWWTLLLLNVSATE